VFVEKRILNSLRLEVGTCLYNKAVSNLPFELHLPLKNKAGLEVASALEKVFKERKPDKLWVDKGNESYISRAQKLAPLYSTENEEESSIAERQNRTIMEKLFKYFTANSTKKYVDILNELVNRYNTVHFDRHDSERSQ